MKRIFSLLLVLELLLGLGGCGPAASSPTPAPSPTAAAEVPSLVPSSSAFAPSGAIPQQYTCDGEDISPPLQWGEPPAGTQSFALVMDDPDAGSYRHWIIYRLPAATRTLPQGVAKVGELPDGSRQGQNGWGKPGYGGPCPPSGTHRYSFRLYALDVVPDGSRRGQPGTAVPGYAGARPGPGGAGGGLYSGALTLPVQGLRPPHPTPAAPSQRSGLGAGRRDGATDHPFSPFSRITSAYHRALSLIVRASVS